MFVVVAAIAIGMRLIVQKMGWHWHPIDARMLPVFALWILFSFYWSAAGANSAPAENSEPAISTYFHQFLLLTSIYLAVGPLPWLTHPFLPNAPRLFLILGVAIQTASLSLAVWARRHLGRNWSAEVRIAVDHQLIRTGPYKNLRHPIYTGVLGMVLGSAIVVNQYHALLGFVILIVAYLRKTRLEEKILLQTFGDEYDAYKHQTWALMPLLF